MISVGTGMVALSVCVTPELQDRLEGCLGDRLCGVALESDIACDAPVLTERIDDGLELREILATESPDHTVFAFEGCFRCIDTSGSKHSRHSTGSCGVAHSYGVVHRAEAFERPGALTERRREMGR